MGLTMWKTLSKSVFRISENLTFMKIFGFLSFLEPLGTSIILFSCALPSTEFSINYTIPPRTSGSSTPLAFLMKINISFYSVRNIIKKRRTKSSEQEIPPADPVPVVPDACLGQHWDAGKKMELKLRSESFRYCLFH